ncbi:MAG: acetolactate synthase, partial [Rhodospirillaceae bacterium]|nr:acetolactate synthase [Rhodospirillaceae bacterium]
MIKNSQAIADHLARAGVRALFGVQGGAAAHLIEATCMHDDMHFIPVLNEQAAGLAAHGHFFAHGAPAGA